MKIFIFLLIFGLCNSQNHRFTYELKFKSDSLQTNPKYTNMILDIEKEIKFYDLKFLEIDSIRKKTNQDITINSDANMLLKRQHNSFTNTNYEVIDETYYLYTSTDNMSWKIHNDVKYLSNYILQKATVGFGGRNWTAWFCREIPFFEGPYKFRGLPGLIFEIYDDHENYHFTVVKIQNTPSFDTSEFLESNYGDLPLKISDGKRKELLFTYYNDPYWRAKRGKIFQISTADGNTYTDPKDLTELTRKKKITIRENNNPIEIDKALKY